MTITAAALLLFLVMDPLGNVPLFLSSLKGVAPARQTIVVGRELLIAYVVLVAFLFGGRFLLDALHISEEALTIAGAIVLFLIALKMVFPTQQHGLAEPFEGEPFIVPLAIPYVAGPSAMATILLLMSRESDRWPEWLAALTIAWGASAAILIMGSHLRKLLGQRGLTAMERLMGMVLVALAVQMFVEGLRTALSPHVT
jgi:multiple antibiotic resistance protein